jgi:hypothetical protein
MIMDDEKGYIHGSELLGSRRIVVALWRAPFLPRRDLKRRIKIRHE